MKGIFEKSRRELNGTRLLVHAGNCRQLFAVFRRFFVVSRFFPRKFQSLVFAVFRCFFAVFRFFLREPLSAYHWAPSQRDISRISCGHDHHGTAGKHGPLVRTSAIFGADVHDPKVYRNILFPNFKSVQVIISGLSQVFWRESITSLSFGWFRAPDESAPWMGKIAR